ncbi:hypothetical protein CERZMDRAFT_90481 [Cercospora zeae-maydis SCOH1-5]|uniref:Uncharacterized protein n=1 Tax=Cercospora zeae-maydis SCOH1-5 TaxID=717836 RepID=A0A6A6FJK7_9PEZI|nr:hypothetical protein CERZMDRAFT_90481 [Cercospora zeae-maydis SCOH1-5]
MTAKIYAIVTQSVKIVGNLLARSSCYYTSVSGTIKACMATRVRLYTWLIRQPHCSFKPLARPQAHTLPYQRRVE